MQSEPLKKFYYHVNQLLKENPEVLETYRYKRKLKNSMLSVRKILYGTDKSTD